MLQTGYIARKVKDKGFGFIAEHPTVQGREWFFHRSQCITPFETLLEKDRVVFEEQETSKGLRAIGVRAE
jgi:cold shock CspA family protein